MSCVACFLVSKVGRAPPGSMGPAGLGQGTAWLHRAAGVVRAPRTGPGPRPVHTHTEKAQTPGGHSGSHTRRTVPDSRNAATPAPLQQTTQPASPVRSPMKGHVLGPDAGKAHLRPPGSAGAPTSPTRPRGPRRPRLCELTAAAAPPCHA